MNEVIISKVRHTKGSVYTARGCYIDCSGKMVKSNWYHRDTPSASIRAARNWLYAHTKKWVTRVETYDRGQLIKITN